MNSQPIPKPAGPAFIEPMQCMPVTALPAGSLHCGEARQGRHAILAPPESAWEFIETETPPVKIAILHGPNLDRLGKREPEISGRATLKDLEKLIRTEARRLGFSTVFFQSAHEGALIDRIHALTDWGRRRLHRQFRCLLSRAVRAGP